MLAFKKCVVEIIPPYGIDGQIFMIWLWYYLSYNLIIMSPDEWLS